MESQLNDIIKSINTNVFQQEHLERLATTIRDKREQYRQRKQVHVKNQLQIGSYVSFEGQNKVIIKGRVTAIKMKFATVLPTNSVKAWRVRMCALTLLQECLPCLPAAPILVPRPFTSSESKPPLILYGKDAMQDELSKLKTQIAALEASAAYDPHNKSKSTSSTSKSVKVYRDNYV